MKNKKGNQENLNPEKVDSKKFPKLAKATELASNYKIRAEKAEAEIKKAKAEEETSKNTEDKTSKNEYSLQDIRSLSDVHDDDVESIEKFAKMENLSISEAKNHADMQAILSSREEKRKTAEATNTGGGRHGTNKVSGKALLREFDKSGEVPETDKEMDAMLEAEFEAKKTN